MSEVKSKHLRLPVDIIEAIEKYQEKDYIQHFNQAVVILLTKALEEERVLNK